jgi:hypothetical protein
MKLNKLIMQGILFGFSIAVISACNLDSQFAYGNEKESIEVITDINTSDIIVNDKSYVTVGDSGDYQTVNEAIEALSAIYPSYKAGGFNARITILSGTVLDESIDVQNANLGWITIDSQDKTVDVYGVVTTAFIRGVNSIMPMIVSDFRSTGIRDVGISLNRSQMVFFGGLEGFRSGLEASNGSYFQSSDFFVRDGIGFGNGVTALGGSTVLLGGVSQVRNMGGAGIFVDNSNLTMINGIISSNGKSATILNQSIVDLSLCTIVNSQFSPEISISGGSNVDITNGDFTPTFDFASVLVSVTDSKVILNNINFDEPSQGNAVISNNAGEVSIMNSSRFHVVPKKGAITKVYESTLFVSPQPNLLTKDGIVFQ